jgi:2-keto-3-deoxy-L-rhamnonate aldolase RhmA
LIWRADLAGSAVVFDPRHPTLRRRLERGDAIGAIWLSLGSAAICEIAAGARPDAIVLDRQHGLWERAAIEAAIGATSSDVPVLVRVAENAPHAIGEALDAGAEGVIVPLVETADQAHQAVRAAHYPPRGARSGGGVRPLADFVAYVEGARAGTVVVVMIETARGVENARAIAAVEGVDLVFIGVGDLALSLGAFPQFDARHEAACEAVFAACRAEQRLCGAFTHGVEAAKARREQGYRLMVTANDIDTAGREFRESSGAFTSATTRGADV